MENKWEVGANDKERDKIIRSRMKLDQFVGIFPNAINNNLCSDLLKWFNLVSENGLTMSSMEESSLPGTNRTDEVLLIPSELTDPCFPKKLTGPLWYNIAECYNIYHNYYNIDRLLSSYSFKAHKVLPTGGYHIWHHEHWFGDPYRVLAWHLNLEIPKKGGETEFLFQSIRVEPQVGQLMIWPAGFTHKHRGNPPLEGQKIYLTGWFDESGRAPNKTN